MAYAAHAAQALRMLSEAAAGAESAAEESAQSQTEAAMSQQTSASSSEAASAPSPPAAAEASWDTVTLKSFVFLDFKFWMNYATGAVRISVNLMVVRSQASPSQIRPNSAARKPCSPCTASRSRIAQRARGAAGDERALRSPPRPQLASLAFSFVRSPLAGHYHVPDVPHDREAHCVGRKDRYVQP